MRFVPKNIFKKWKLLEILLSKIYEWTGDSR